jgi:polyhydroxybutyrate depolymerase
MRVPWVVAALVVVSGLATTSHAQVLAEAADCNVPHASGVQEQRLVSGGRDRTYRLFVPAGYDGRTRLPLVLDLHGSGGSSAGQARNSRFEDLAAREAFAVATLQAEDARWNVPVAAERADDVAYVRDVIDHVAAQLCIDRARVYATGFSGGGRMSSLLGCRLNDRIAAIAPVSALRWPAPCEGRPVPVLVDYDVFMGVRRLDAQNVSSLQKLYKAEDLDFRLRPGSAAVDRGTVLPTVTDGFGGRAPDLGALEVGATPPHYGPRP